MHYTFEAGHIADFQSLMTEVRAMENVHEATGGRNATFSLFHTIFVDTDEKTASKIQDLIFEYNDGAYCRFAETIYAEEEDYV